MSDPSHHVEIHLDARHPGEQRVVLNGEDLTEGIASFTLHASARDRLPFLQLEPLVITGVVAANVAAPVLAMADATRAALVAGGWTPPADPDTDPGLPFSALFDNQPTTVDPPETRHFIALVGGSRALCTATATAADGRIHRADGRGSWDPIYDGDSNATWYRVSAEAARAWMADEDDADA